MCLDPVRGQIAVTTADRIVDAVVLDGQPGGDGGEVRIRAQCSELGRPHRDAQRGRQLGEQHVPARAGDREVERRVAIVELLGCDVEIVHRSQLVSHRGMVGECRLLGGEASRLAFERDARPHHIGGLEAREHHVQRDEMGERVARYGRHQCGRVRSGGARHDRTHRFQHTNRLADGWPADPKRCRQVALGRQSVADLEPATRDLFLDPPQNDFVYPPVGRTVANAVQAATKNYSPAALRIIWSGDKQLQAHFGQAYREVSAHMGRHKDVCRVRRDMAVPAIRRWPFASPRGKGLMAIECRRKSALSNCRASLEIGEDHGSVQDRRRAHRVPE